MYYDLSNEVNTTNVTSLSLGPISISSELSLYPSTCRNQNEETKIWINISLLVFIYCLWSLFNINWYFDIFYDCS